MEANAKVEVSEVSQVQTSNDALPADTPVEVGEVSQVSVCVSVIPGESERPCFRVLNDWHAASETKYRPGVWHFGIKAGKPSAVPALTEQWVCSPLHIDAVTTDAQDGNYGRLLRLRTTLGRWLTWSMPMELLRGDGSDLRGVLLAMGLEIDPHARNLLATYLQSPAPRRRIHCSLQTGWAGTDFHAYVLPDEVIGPKSGQIAYQSAERGQDDYTVGGTLIGWQQSVSAMAVGNPLLALGLCAAFAGPLLARCNAESGGLHFVGDSSTGKTTIMDAACSVWGGTTYRRTWRTTGNGLEGVAALFNDSLLALDEISECDPREVGAIVYALGNGRGKQRASRTGAARALYRWRSSVLSSGERTIATTMADVGQRIKAGQSVRLLDVPAKRRHGAWDDLHSHASGMAFSDALKRGAATHYGHAGRAFLEKLTRDHSTNFTDALDVVMALPEFSAMGGDGQIKRAATRFALLALAGELATEYGVTGWLEGEAIRAAAVGLAAWRALRGKCQGNIERDDIAERLAGFIQRHGDSRFSDADGGDDERGGIVRDRAGWWEERGGQRVYLFTADGMREALKGFDFNRALDVLQELAVIGPLGTDGKRAKFRRIRGQGVKVYEVDPAQLDTEGA
jgi:putative DNA primase/helicase